MKPIFLALEGQGWIRQNYRSNAKRVAENVGCRNFRQLKLGSFADKDYSVEECDIKCMANDQCEMFIWGKNGNKFGDCDLFKSGC